MGLRVALVCGAGGVVGGAYIDACLDALSEACGFELDFATVIVGTSAGSFRAARAKPDCIGDIDGAALKQLANRRDWRPRFYDRPLASLRLTGGRILARRVPTDGRLPDYRVPAGPHHEGAVAVSVRLDKRERVVHRLAGLDDRQGVVDAVRASSAVPFATAAIDVDGQLHTDGAVHSPTNADLCPPDTFDLLLVIAPMVASGGGTFLEAIHRVQLRREIAPWYKTKKPIVVFTPTADERKKKSDAEAFAAAGRSAVENR